MKKLRTSVSIILTLVLFSSMTFGALAESVQSSAGEVDIHITVSKDGDTTTTNKQTDGTVQTEDGTLVNWQETTEETLIYDMEGNLIGYQKSSEGSETTEKPADQKDVTLDLIVDSELQGTDNGDGTHTVVSGGETTTEPTNLGDDLKSENLNNYNQTTTTDREVEVTVSDPKATTGPIVFVDENGNPIELHPGDEGYDFYAFPLQYAGVEGLDGPMGGKLDLTPYNTVIRVLDANGNVVKEILDEPVVQRTIIDKTTGEKHDELYCADVSTSIFECFDYRRANLEDAVAEGYYSEEEAKHLRAIAMHGYNWSDGAESGANLDEIKAMMLAALEKGEISGVSADEINGLTGSGAAVATGLAIWRYGNRFEIPEGGSISMAAASDDAAINALYQYLIQLEEEAPNTETQIINEEKFVKDMDITVGTMVEGSEFNQDADSTNDMYNVSLSFSLVVEPDPENDNLIVKVVDNHGNVIRSARIAGEGEDETDKLFDGITLSKNENDETVYTFTDLQLQENSNTTFNLTLEGAQLLNEGVYIYKSKDVGTPAGTAQEWIDYYKETGVYEIQVNARTGKKFQKDADGNWVPKASNTDYTWEQAEADMRAALEERYGKQTSGQNFIGVMSGYADVDVSMSVDLTFNVEEGTIRTEREWYSYTAPEFEPIEITPPPTDREEPVVYSELPDEEPPLSEEPEVVEEEVTEIPEEEVPMAEYEEIPEVELPLADVPQTGDASALWIVLAVLSLTGLAALSFGKKRAA